MEAEAICRRSEGATCHGCLIRRTSSTCGGRGRAIARQGSLVWPLAVGISKSGSHVGLAITRKHGSRRGFVIARASCSATISTAALNRLSLSGLVSVAFLAMRVVLICGAARDVAQGGLP